jgi:glutamine synthetase
VEIHARYEIELEAYTKKIQIEGRVIGDIARNHVIPTAINYQNKLISNVQGLKDIFGKDFEKYAQEQINLIKEISEHIKEINSNVTNMTEARKVANNIEDTEEKAYAYCDKVRPFFEVIRYHCDKLEILIDDELWTLVKYRELLFTR